MAGLIAGALAAVAAAVDLLFVRRPEVKRMGVLRVLLDTHPALFGRVVPVRDVADPLVR